MTFVRAMTEHDLLEVCEIEETSHLSFWGWENYYKELAREEAIALVAVAPDARLKDLPEVKGFIIARVVADELQINNIAVRDEERRKGIGGALLRAAVREGKKRGAQVAVLEVRASNVAAQKLYEKYDFALCGRRKKYYRDPTEDAFLLCAELQNEK